MRFPNSHSSSTGPLELDTLGFQPETSFKTNWPGNFLDPLEPYGKFYKDYIGVIMGSYRSPEIPVSRGHLAFLHVFSDGSSSNERMWPVHA